jgi:hypothetical protein
VTDALALAETHAIRKLQYVACEAPRSDSDARRTADRVIALHAASALVEGEGAP